MNPLSLLAGVPCAGIPFLLCVSGYGAYLRVSCIFSIPALIGVSFMVLYACRTARNLGRRQSKTSPVSQGRDKILFLLFLGVSILSWCCGKQVRIWHCESICTKLAPALESLEQYRSGHGNYPAKLSAIPDFDRLAGSAGISVREGSERPGGVTVYILERPDLVVYLRRDHYLCVVPLEHPVIMSFTRFTILRRDSQSPLWTEDHMIWSLSRL